MQSSLSKVGGYLKTGFTIGAAAIGTATTALVAMGKASVQSYAQLEQNVGGVETLFKGSAQKVIENANNAYKTAGLSANEYMSNVTSFSASLLQSVAGDTDKAADVADMAMVDMSDNANKMGTDMSAIQNAYQGFAKQNYTMLDNLKLGYGGTRTEMERLLKDAQKITGVKYDISNLSDVYEAIHVIQGELGITGTTAKEAEETISGSIASLKGAWDNFLNGSGNLGQVLKSAVTVIKNISNAVQKLIPEMIQSINEWLPDIVEEGKEIILSLLEGIIDNLESVINCGVKIIEALIQSITSVLPNLAKTAVKLVADIAKAILNQLPLIVDCGIQVILELAKGIIEELPGLLEQIPTIIQQIADVLVEHLPELIEVALKLIQTLVEGLAQHIDKMTKYAPKIVETIVDTLMEHMDELIPVAIEVLVSLITGLAQALPQLITFTPKIIFTIISTLVSHLPDILSTGIKLIGELIKGIGQKLWDVGEKAGEIGKKIKEKIQEYIDKAVEWGKDLVQNLIKGMQSKKPSVVTATTGVMGAIKSLMHFSKPDKGPMRDYEKWMPDMVEGLARTLEESSPTLEKKALSLAQRLKSAVAMGTSELSNSLTGTGVMNIQRNAEITATLSSIDSDREITVNAVTNLDGRVLTQTVNKVNARQKLAYGF
jgi:phage-related protein